MAVYTKIPRKLKKSFKKLKLACHSESYKRYRKMTAKKITITYYDSDRQAFGAEIK